MRNKLRLFEVMQNTAPQIRRICALVLAMIIGFAMITCSDPEDTTPTVTVVTVNPATANVAKGGTKTFTAAVTGTNSPAQTVTWSIVQTNKNSATTINASGVLNVAAAETLTSLTVKATSTVDTSKSGTATVTITITSDDTPQAPVTQQPFNDITAAQLVANIKIGWNLGNSLDAANLTWLPANPTVTQMETGWSNPVTTKSMITAIKNAGFNAIRIPVSWTKAAGGAPNYTIRADWMARVVEVVNYAVDNDMYIILNTHHDEDVLTFMNSNAAAGKAAFQKLWEQIADTFKNYNEKLIFEGLNEPRTIGSANEWNGGTAEERANLNSYYPIFVNTVRNSGGNNDKRILMITPYAASATSTAVNALNLPADTVANKLIVSIHAYTPYDFCYPYSDTQTANWSSSNSSDTGTIQSVIQPAYDKFVGQGTPVIIGEFGSVNKNNTAARAAWAEYYVTYAKSKGIPCFFWDNGVMDIEDPENFGIFNRSNNTFDFSDIKDALMRGAANTAPPSESGLTIIFESNDPYGYQKMYNPYSLFNGAKVTTGDVYTFNFTFKSNVAIDKLQVLLVDNCEETGWGWKPLSGYIQLKTNIAANTEYSGSVTINTTGTATNNTPEANRLVFETGTGTTSAPTLTFTVFSLVKN